MNVADWTFKSQRVNYGLGRLRETIARFLKDASYSFAFDIYSGYQWVAEATSICQEDPPSCKKFQSFMLLYLTLC